MPRIAEGRTPATPTSARQVERYRRILRAAAHHGAAHGLDGVQMHDVAGDADVAIATLYRYFPSKTQLFTALMNESVSRLSTLVTDVPSDQDRAGAVASLLNRAADELLAYPLLAQAMLQSNNASVAGPDPGEATTQSFTDLILRVARVTAPSELDERLVRLVEQTWYGLLISTLNGLITQEQAHEDTLLACQLLCSRLAEGSTARSSAEVAS